MIDSCDNFFEEKNQGDKKIENDRLLHLQMRFTYLLITFNNSIYARAPIGTKNYQCHFETLRFRDF